MARTNIAVVDNLADGLSTEATRRNKTLYAFANESLEAILRVCREEGSPSEIYPSWRFSRMLKDVDSIPIPGDLLEKMIKKLHESDNEWVLKAWFEEGRRLGTYLRMAYPQFEDLSTAVREFQQLLPVKRIELRKAATEDRGVSYVLRAVGVGLSAESTNCAEHLIQGIISSYARTVKASRVSEGMIEVEVA